VNGHLRTWERKRGFQGEKKTVERQKNEWGKKVKIKLLPEPRGLLPPQKGTPGQKGKEKSKKEQDGMGVGERKTIKT